MTAMPTTRNVYRAQVIAPYDGDTFRCRIEIFPGFFHESRLRMARVNAPELATEAGKAAATFTAKWLSDAPWPINMALHYHHVSFAHVDYPLLVQIGALDNYGRPLATVWRVSDGRCLNDDLISAGMAVPYTVPLTLD